MSKTEEKILEGTVATMKFDIVPAGELDDDGDQKYLLYINGVTLDLNSDGKEKQYSSLERAITRLYKHVKEFGDRHDDAILSGSVAGVVGGDVTIVKPSSHNAMLEAAQERQKVARLAAAKKAAEGDNTEGVKALTEAPAKVAK